LDSNVLWPRWIVCSLLVAAFAAAADDPEMLLSSLKRETLSLQSKKNHADATQLRFGWINAVTLGYADSRNTQFDRTQTHRGLLKEP